MHCDLGLSKDLSFRARGIRRRRNDKSAKLANFRNGQTRRATNRGHREDNFLAGATLGHVPESAKCELSQEPVEFLFGGLQIQVMSPGGSGPAGLSSIASTQLVRSQFVQARLVGIDFPR